MSKAKSSNQWKNRQNKDHYVKARDQEGYRSRASFKLVELHEKERLFKPNQTIVDLGAAPGGWSQVAKSLVGKKGRVFALDILEMDPINGVEFIKGDFTDNTVLERLLEALGDTKVDWILSDMAPNMSGVRAVDQAKCMYLAELALDLANAALCSGGSYLVKIFQGAGYTEYYETLKRSFKTVKSVKPPASRKESRELYLLARSFKKS